MVLQKKKLKILAQGWPWERKHDLANSSSKHAQTLIELAGTYQDLNSEVASEMAQWIVRSKQKAHQ
jgi:hypothetical protein